MVDDVSRLAQRLKLDFPAVPEPTDQIWSATPAEKIIDCVLSLNRSYDTFVAPRVTEFRMKHPTITSAHHLLELIEAFRTPAAFLAAELRTDDPSRAATLAGVTRFVIRAASRFSDEETEDGRLRAWAEDARPGDYLGAGIKGFGLAGWQYLRMLFGADTSKPDVHVIRYVSAAVDRDVSQPEALYLLEAAAARVGVSLRGVDVAIWEKGARPGAI